MHDQNFKNLILDYPREALAFFAQAEAGSDLGAARIIPIRQEQLQERLGERFRELDTPLLLEWPDGRRAGILFVFEEETQTSRFSIHRLAHYCLDLAELFSTERIVPVVIFLRPGTRPATLRLGGDARSYLDFRYIACDLHRLQAMDYLDSDNLVARLNLPNMAHPPDARLAIYAAAQLGLATLETDSNRQSKYADFIDYYANLSEAEIAHYAANQLNARGELMGLAQQLRQEGWQEGLQAGEANVTLRLLSRRCGPLSEATTARIQTLRLEQLEALADALLDFQGSEDLTAWLAANA